MAYQHLSEAIKYALSRNVVLPQDYYYNFTALQRAQSVSIAGLTQLSQIEHVINQVNQSLITGSTFSDFQKAVKAGDISVNLPKYRLDNIFRTNLQVAYNRGRWERQQRVKASRPYLMYSAINDSRTRPAHRALDGTIRPIDDPFWLNHYPTLGYRCRCTTIALTKEQMLERGGVTDAPDVSADKGWGHHMGDYSAGLSQALETIATKSTALPQATSAVVKIKAQAASAAAFDPESVIDRWLDGATKQRYLIEFKSNIDKLTFAHQYGLTEPEMLAIRHYTGKGYNDLNLFLNGNTGFNLERENTLMDTATLLSNALNKLPNHVGTVVRRTSLPEAFLAEHVKGQVVTYNAFTSSTYGQKDAFLGLIRLVIKSKTGKKVNVLSVFDDQSSSPEYEVLFGRPKRFEVVDRIDKLKEEGYIEIHLEELED
jgi:SPP1 gp7 family putative phage head morphogenesis protein